MRPDNLRRLLLIPLLFASSAAWAGDPLPFGYIGRWDVTLQTPQGDRPTWLDIADGDSAGPIVHMVGRWGHARRLPSALYAGGQLSFVSPKEEEGGKNDMKFTLWLKDDALVGETTGPDGTVWKLRGERAPSLKRKGIPTWQAPIILFNGNDLAGWHLSDPKAAPTWVVENGNLVSLGNGAELITDQKFDDFKLHIEFKVAPGANSGIYLRGRYEVQVEHDSHPEAAERSLGGVYGFLAPSPMPSHTPDVWRAYEITLIGRHVTVVLDGVTLIKDQEIPGVTGGALDTREGEPGPLYLQGSENGRVEFRHVQITPAAGQ